MGSASGSFLPHHLPSFYGLRTILIQIPDSTLPPFLFFFSSPPVYLAFLFLFFFLHSSLELLNSFSYFVSSPCSIRMDISPFYRFDIGRRSEAKDCGDSSRFVVEEWRNSYEAVRWRGLSSSRKKALCGRRWADLTRRDEIYRICREVYRL